MSKEFVTDLAGKLRQAKSKQQVNANIRQLEKAVRMLRITATLAKGDTRRKLDQCIDELGGKLSYVKLKGRMDDKILKREIEQSLHNMTFKEIDALNIDSNKAKLKLQKAMADLMVYAEKTPISVNVSLKKKKLCNDLTTFLNKNSKIRESNVLLAESERIRELIDSVYDKGTLRNATNAFSLFQSEVVSTGFAGKSTSQKIKDMLGHISNIGSFFGVASLAVNSFRKSLSTLRSNDTILTGISKTSEMTKQQLKALGNEAFKVASKYGQLSGNYLIGVQEMARSGYESLSKELAELSLLAQSAGDMTAENANNYLLATDAAYKYYGSVEKLNAALDGANYISKKNSVSLTDIADATRVSASFAANAGVAIDELTAAEAAMIATTKRSGSEIGHAFRSIILNLQQVSGEFDGEIIDEEQLKKVEARCHSLGVELEYLKDGKATFRNPMEVLKDLAKVYNSLPDNSAEKQGLISDIGGKYHANPLSSLLSQWDLYEKILNEFSRGTGSALEEANKTADSWEGRIAKLQNSWDSFINTLTNKEAIMGGISFFDRLIQGAETLTNIIGEIPIALTALNSALVATNKDYGITQIWNKDKGKIDLQGNLLGINITNIKNMKKHLAEAERAIQLWNDTNSSGENVLGSFKNNFFQNNAQFKDYLSTCSKDVPASLEGYKSYLKSTGVNTDALRLKTILLNSAITMLGGLAIQAVITGFNELLQVNNKVAERAEELGDSFKSTKSDIESYKSRIEELHNTINDSNSSIEDVANARQTLLSVQNELIDKFGTEEGVIRDVTDAIDGQTDALDGLTQTKWQETLNEFDNGGFWNDAANFFQGTDNIKRMFDEYGEKTISIKWADYVDINELTDEMVAELENIGIDINVKTDNLQADRDFDSLTESIKDTKGASLALSGNAEEIYKKLLSLQNLIGNDDSFDKLYDKVDNIADSYKEIIDQYKNFYDQYILQEKILTKDSDYVDTFKNITDFAEKYNKAFISGDETKIKEAADEYASILSTAISVAIANGDSDVATYFENMYPTLKSIVDGWQFNVAFDANTDDLQGKVQNVLNELKDEDGRSLTAEEILGLGESNAQYQALVAIAHTYNMTIEEMIELLKERNLVSNMDYQGLVGLFGKENVGKLTPEDLEIAYTIKNVGNMTFEQLQDKIRKAKETTEEPVTISVSDTITQLNTRLKPAFDSLKSAYQNIFTDDGEFALNSVDILSTCDSIKSKLDELNKLDGITVDYSAFEDFVRVLNNTESTEQDVENAFDALATSITQEALSGAEDFETLKSALEDLGVVNEELVAFESLVNNTEALKEVGLDLAEATDEQIHAFANEMVSAENVSNAIAMLTFQKQLCNLQEMDTADEVANLLTLAQDAGYTGEIIEHLTELEQIYQQVASGTLTQKELDAKLARTEELQGLIKDSTGKINYEPKVDFNGTGGKKSAGSAGKEAADDYLEAFEKELEEIDRLRDNNTITEKEYLDRLRVLYRKYFGDRREYLKEYRKYERQYLEGMKSLYESALNGVVSLLDRQIDACQDRKDTAVDALEEERDAAVEVLETQREALEEQIALIEEQANAKEKIIDGIRDEIDAIEEANEARQREIELQKAKYSLERMQNQNTILQYSGDKGMHYVQDASGIRDARQEVEDAERESEIAKKEDAISLIEKEIDILEEEKGSLQEEIDSLGEKIDRTNEHYEKLIEDAEKYWDGLIKGLEDYRSRWEALGETEEQAKILSALEQLGISAGDVLNLSGEAFIRFKEEYLGILAELYSGNDSMLSAISDAAGQSTGQMGSYIDAAQGYIDRLGGLGESLAPVSEAIREVDRSMSDLSSTASGAYIKISGTAAGVGSIAASLGEAKAGLSEAKVLLADEQAAFGSLRQAIDAVTEAIDQKTEAVRIEQLV